MTTICRVCQARSTGMHIIRNTPYQTVFEKLSGVMLIIDDGKPDTICYICFALLQKCWKFKEMSQKTDKLLKESIYRGDKFPEKPIRHGSPFSLTMSTIKCVSMPEYIKNENPEVKEELIGDGMLLDIQTGDDPVKLVPLEYDIRLKTNLLKQEQNHEFDGESLNISCLSSLDETKTTSKSKNSVRQNAKVRKKCTKNTTIKTSTATGKKSPTCPISNKLFQENVDLSKHMKMHTDTKTFTCLKCIETFTNKYELQKHIVLHTGHTLYMCDMCAKALTSKHNLKIHINQKHMKVHTTKTHVCDQCNKSFNHRGTLRLHMRTHTGDKPYACDKCLKTFSQKATLQRHMRMHTGEKPYACDKCTKTFNQASSLKRHIKMHTGDKPYACNRCGKAYYESSHLTRHLRTHTGEKPYACDQCFQTFSQSSNLQAHMRKHTGEKATNYICYECNKTFDHKSIFKRHLLKHTQEKPYPCNRCDKKYADKRTLQRHNVTHNLTD